METNKMNIFQKMRAIQSELGYVSKNLNVQVSKTNAYKAVSEVDVLEAVKPLEEKYGVYSYPCNRELVESDTLVQSTQYGDKQNLYLRIKVTYRFVNTDNPDDYIETISYADGIDSGDKATGKAMTYADKYALMKAYKISTGDDPDKDASQEYKKGKVTPVDADQILVDYATVKATMDSYGIDFREKLNDNILKATKLPTQDITQLDPQQIATLVKYYNALVKKFKQQKGV